MFCESWAAWVGSHSWLSVNRRNLFPRKRQRMSSDTNKELGDLFAETVKGKVLISENSGAAKAWLPRDVLAPGPYVPRPDCSLGTLKFLSAFPFTSVLGIDHFYLRSPITGLIKLFTLGGGGLWALWDGIQVLTESDRVLKYGMSAPLDIVTGIGQGMITDKSSAYTSTASYSAWIVGIAFGFLGLDSLIAKNGGQFLRKLLEFILFIACMITIVNVFNTGITWKWILAIIFASFLGSIIIAEYLAVVTAVFGNDVFTQGIEFTEKQDKQINGFFSWLIKNTSFSAERKAEIIKDLQYGGLSPDDIVKMFSIMHTSEAKRVDQSYKTKSNNSAGSIVSFVLLMCAPFLIVWNGLVSFGRLLRDGFIAITPWAPVVMGAKIAGVVGLKQAGLLGAAEELGLGPLAAAVGNSPNVDAGALGGLANTLMSANKTPAPVQSGGAKTESLSTEAQIFGAVTVALIGGGAIKGLVDYLMKE